MFTVDAVYALAHALHNMYAERCGAVPFSECESMRPAPLGTDLLKYIHNVSFYGRQNTQVNYNALICYLAKFVLPLITRYRSVKIQFISIHFFLFYLFANADSL